jgi:hypothetical protein
MQWTQPKRLKNDFLLRSQDQIWGTLQYDDNSFIHQALARTAQEDWRFKYTRYTLPKVTIQKKNDIIAQAILETNWGWRGTLILPNHKRYSWTSTDDSDTEYQFVKSDGQALVIFRPRFGFLKLEAEVEIDPAFQRNPHLPLLTMVGWYLVLLRLR